MLRHSHKRELCKSIAIINGFILQNFGPTSNFSRYYCMHHCKALRITCAGSQQIIKTNFLLDRFKKESVLTLHYIKNDK